MVQANSDQSGTLDITISRGDEKTTVTGISGFCKGFSRGSRDPAFDFTVLVFSLDATFVLCTPEAGFVSICNGRVVFDTR